jgi:hypothetical protein
MRAPVLAIVDGALAFCKALPEVFPATKEQKCWFHLRRMFLPRFQVRASGRQGRAGGDLQCQGPPRTPPWNGLVMHVPLLG